MSGSLSTGPADPSRSSLPLLVRVAQAEEAITHLDRNAGSHNERLIAIENLLGINAPRSMDRPSVVPLNNY